MANILPGRSATRLRLATGFGIVAGVSLTNVIAFDLGPFGSPWPAAILWASCGWANYGPNPLTAILIFCLGLWVDMVTGGHFGIWPLIGLLSHAATILCIRFMGIAASEPMFRAGVTGALIYLAGILVSFWLGEGLNVFGSLLSILSAIGSYYFVGRWFELDGVET